MAFNKADRFRLYPIREQRLMFAKTFGCVRFVYNKMLAARLQGQLLTPAKFKLDFPWLKEVDSLALCNAQLNLSNAFKNYKKNPRYFKFPAFKSRKQSRQRYSTNLIKGRDNLRLEGDKIRLPKIGLVKFVRHRDFGSGEILKSATIELTPSGRYFVSINVEYENQILELLPTKYIGLDYSMTELYVDSDGNHADYPRYYRASERKLATAQQKFSRKILGSRNREKCRLKLARLHEHVANQRRDFLHKLSRRLADSYDAICIEDLNMTDMSRALSFGKSVNDNGWGAFTRMLEYKLRWQGKQLIKIGRWEPTSQTCPCCGYKNRQTKNLKMREWECPKCGAHHDRDINAALNIREKGKYTVGRTGINACGEVVRRNTGADLNETGSSFASAPRNL